MRQAPSSDEWDPYGEDVGGGGSAPTLALYTNTAGGSILFEHGNYRWLQPSEVEAARTYVKANGGQVIALDTTGWAALVKKQQTPGSSNMATGSVPSGQYASRLSGFNASKLADTSYSSPKYVFARIASNFDTRDPVQRQAMLQMLRSDPSGYFKNATLGGTKGDQLIISGELDPKFEGINQFDVFGGAGAGDWIPTWQPTGGPGYTPDVTTAASTTAASTPSAAMQVVTPTVAPPPSDYGPTPMFAPLNPYAGMSPEAYRMLAFTNQPWSAVATPTKR